MWKRYSSAILPSSQLHQLPFLPTRCSRSAAAIGPSSRIRPRTLVDEASGVAARPRWIDFHMCSCAILQRNRRCWSLGTMAATWAQYSNSSPSSMASASIVRGCGPRRANSGSSWLRTSTFTESTWITFDAVEHPAQVAAVDPAGRAAVGEALGGERDAAGLGGRELDGSRVIDQISSARRSAEALDGVEEGAGVVVGDGHRQREHPAGRGVEAGVEEVVEEQLAPARVGVVELGGARRPTGWTHSSEPQPVTQNGSGEASKRAVEPGPQAVTALVHGGEGVGADELGRRRRRRRPS